jgi:adenosylhomocysteinase
LLYVIENRANLENHVYNVPEEIDQRVARLKLQAEGIKIDELTVEQKTYLNSWEN